jgi:GH24 family phage-related lysozyme (muramidase)
MTDTRRNVPRAPETTRQFIERHEGFRLKPYKDTHGLWTWGYGCQITDPLIIATLNAGCTWTLTCAQANALFAAAFARATGEARATFLRFPTLSPARRTALVSLCYHLGGKGIEKFHEFYKAILRRDWPRAADELRFKDGLTKHAPSQYAIDFPDRCAETARLLETGLSS